MSMYELGESPEQEGSPLLAGDRPLDNKQRLWIWRQKYNVYQMCKPLTSLRDWCDGKS